MLGLGCVLGSLITGKIMDRDYKREANRYRKEHSIPLSTELKQQNFPDFPIERARLRSVYLLNAMFVVSTALYGTAVEWHIAIPLVLQFFGASFSNMKGSNGNAAAFSATAIFNINSTIMIDLYPSKPASATAIVRHPKSFLPANVDRITLFDAQWGASGLAWLKSRLTQSRKGGCFCCWRRFLGRASYWLRWNSNMAPSGVVKGWSARGCCGVSRPFLGRRKKIFASRKSALDTVI